MFQNILPDHVLGEVRKQRELDTLPKQIIWVQGELSRFNDSRLSKWNMSKLVQQLKGAPKNATSVNMVGSDHTSQTSEEVPAPPVPDLASFQANIERMVAAALSKDDRGRGQDDRGRGRARTPQGSRQGSRDSKGQSQGRNRAPNPRFQGCWCCGDLKHSRQNCPKFAAIKKANNGKVPADYEGAYEKSLKTKVSVVQAEIAKPETYPETFMWPLLTAPIIPKQNKVPPTIVKNRYHSLGDDSDDDDEDEVVKALAMISSNVHLRSDRMKSQKERRNQAGKGLDLAKIMAVAQQVVSGEIQLPDILLDSDEEYECCWALVDSGAGVNCASRKHFPTATPVEAPEVILTTANGKSMPNQGAMKVVTLSKEGIERERIFYDAPVDMPILSVAELSHEGPEGSETRFRKTNGFVEDNSNGDRQHFVKRKGVYFMKLYTKRLVNSVIDKPDKGFGRPGNP